MLRECSGFTCLQAAFTLIMRPTTKSPASYRYDNNVFRPNIGGNMHNGRFFRWLYLVLLATVLAGCTSSATITSDADKGRHSEIHRLLIVSNLWPLNFEGGARAPQASIIETTLVEAFRKCGIVADVVREDRFSPTDDRTEVLRVFSPDAVFVLETRSFEYGVAKGGGIYSGKIVDVTTKKLVWQAQVRLTAGQSREEILVASILDRLKDDSILCPS